ncbi:MAG: hypothetical protein LH616_04870 [Ilumatobacteraceae bacterium]|nr:hypothetical protein [Ilumatobacteraceae bacterium]
MSDEGGSVSRWARWPRPSVGAIALGIMLVIATPILLRARSGPEWFGGDDWGLLVNRSLRHPSDLLRPHNGHWSTVPIAIYQTIYAAFGLKHFLVYKLMVVVAHLTTVSLVWLLIRRLGVGQLLSFAVVAPLVLMGAMSTNLTNPIQISQVGSIAFGLAYFIATDHDGGLDRRDLVGMAMGLLALASSGMGLIVVLTLGVFLLLRRGSWRVAAVHVGVLGTIYLLWQLGYGRTGAASYSSSVIGRWVWQGLSAAFSLPTGSRIAGLLLAIATGAGLVLMVVRRGWSQFRASRAVVPAFLFGALLNFTVIATRRFWLGDAAASTDRYVYVSVVFLLPVIALALDEFRFRVRWLPYVLVLPLVVGIPHNLSALGVPPAINFEKKSLFLGAVHDPLADQVRPDISLNPSALVGREVTIGWLLEASRGGKLPDPPTLSAADRDIIEMRLSISQRSESNLIATCRTETGPIDLDLVKGDVVQFTMSVTLTRLEGGRVAGVPVQYYLDALWSPADYLVVEVPTISIRVEAEDAKPLTLCR